MVSVKRTEAVLETIVVEEGHVELNLTEVEAKQLIAILGSARDVSYSPENAYINAIYAALTNVFPEYSSWNDYKVVDGSGNTLLAYIIKPRFTK